MSNELKTLKDLNIQNTSEYDGATNTEGNFVLINDLKQEAIKHIKKYRYYLASYNERCNEDDQRGNIAETEGIINYIKWNNNLIEDDLK